MHRHPLNHVPWSVSPLCFICSFLCHFHCCGCRSLLILCSVDCDWEWPRTPPALWNSIHGVSVTLSPPAALWFYWLKGSLCRTAECHQSESRGQRSRLVEMRQWTTVCLLQLGHNNIILRTQYSTHEKKEEYLRGREAEDTKLFYREILQDSVT